MTVRQLLADNLNIGSVKAPYLNVVVSNNTGWGDVVNANKICEENNNLLDAEIDSWYLCHDQQDIDVIVLRVKLK